MLGSAAGRCLRASPNLRKGRLRSGRADISCRSRRVGEDAALWLSVELPPAVKTLRHSSPTPGTIPASVNTARRGQGPRCNIVEPRRPPNGSRNQQIVPHPYRGAGRSARPGPARRGLRRHPGWNTVVVPQHSQAAALNGGLAAAGEEKPARIARICRRLPEKPVFARAAHRGLDAWFGPAKAAARQVVDILPQRSGGPPPPPPLFQGKARSLKPHSSPLGSKNRRGLGPAALPPTILRQRNTIISARDPRTLRDQAFPFPQE